jgi:c-di-GMP-binding flagellar brake protein YcgR
MSVHCPEQLDKAIQKRLPARLCASVAEERQQLEIRFMHAPDSEQADGFWVELKEHRPFVDRLIQDALTVEISFNLDDAKVFFDSAILRKRNRYWLKRLVLLRFPERISVVEQRGSARTFVPDDVDIYAKIYRAAGPGSHEPLVSWRLFDLSAGGAGVICPHDPRLVSLKPGEPLYVIVTFGEKGLPLNATHRYVQVLSASSIRLGIQFNSLQPTAVHVEFQRLLAQLTEMRTARHIMQTVRRSTHLT